MTRIPIWLKSCLLVILINKNLCNTLHGTTKLVNKNSNLTNKCNSRQYLMFCFPANIEACCWVNRMVYHICDVSVQDSGGIVQIG